MKPTIYLTVVVSVEDTKLNIKRSVTTVFKSKLPTNAMPRKGDFLGIYIWEDHAEPHSQREDVEVTEVYHYLVDKKWEQYIYARAELEPGSFAPEDGTLEKLLNDEFDWVTDFVVPNLEDQGFEVVIKPNTENCTGPLDDK